MPETKEARGRWATRPKEIPRRGWKDVLYRVKAELKDDNLGLVAAGLAFYGMLAFLPGLIALVSLYGLIADPATVQSQIADLAALMPPAAAELVEGQLKELAASDSKSTWGLVLGVLGAIWTASAGTKALLLGVNIAYDEKETRGFVELRALSLALTLGIVVFVVLTIAVVAVLPAMLGRLGLGETGQTLVQWGRWPGLALLMMGGLAIIYRLGGDRRAPSWRWVSIGSIVATVLWLAASAAFSWYAGQFGSYNETYGTLGAGIALMMWLYISGYVVLLGAELNAEIEHQTRYDSTVGRYRPLGQRDAEMADHVGPGADEVKKRSSAA